MFDSSTYHVLDFTGVGIHASGSLTRLDVAPDHGCHITLIVHETSIKVGSLIGVGRLDVGESTREGVLEEVEHGEELARGPDVVSR